MLMLGLDALGGWDVVREQTLSLAMLALSQLVVWLLIRRTMSPARQGVCFLASTALLFGLSQYENFQWGFQMAWFLCDLAMVTVVWLLSRPARGPRDIALAVAIATIGSVSSSQGLIAWACGLIVILAIPRRPVQTGIAWVACGAIVTAIVRAGSPGAGGPGHAGFHDIRCSRTTS